MAILARVIRHEENEERKKELENIAERIKRSHDRVESVLLVSSPQGNERSDPDRSETSETAQESEKSTPEKPKTSSSSAKKNKQKAKSPVESFIDAAKQGDLAQLRHYLETEGVDVNSQDGFGFTALHRAAYWSRKEALEYLVSRGARFDIENRRGQTAVDVAPSEDFLRIIMGDDYKPAAERAKEKSRQLARQRTNRQMERSNTDNPNLKVYTYRREKGSKAEQFVEACKKGKLSDVKKLHEENGVEIGSHDKFGWTGIQRAVFWDRRDVMMYLVEKGADVYEENSKGKSAVDMAPSEEIRMLLEGDKYRTKKQREKAAKRRLHKERTQNLIMKTEDGLANSRSNSATWKYKRTFASKAAEFVDACKRGDINRAKKLFDKYDFHVDDPDEFGWTALHRAVFWDRKKVAAYLVSLGADANIANGKGQTALDLCPSEEMRKIVLGDNYVSVTDRVNSRLRAGFSATRLRRASTADRPPPSSTATREMAKRRNLLAKYMDEDGKNEYEEDLGLEALTGGGTDSSGKKTFVSMLMDEIKKADTSHMTESDKYKWGAMYIQDALAGREIKTENFGKNQLAVYRMLTSPRYFLFYLFFALLFLALTPWEAPSYRSLRIADKIGGFSAWDDEWRAAFFAEGACVFIFTVDLILWMFQAGGSRYFSDNLKIMKFFLVVSFIVDLAVSPMWSTIRVTRVFRPGLFLLHVRAVRSSFYTVLKTLPKIIEVVAVVAVFVVLFGIFGLQLFRVAPGEEDLYNRGTVSERVESFQYTFQDFSQTSVTLYVLLTGSNYPNVMYPAYRENRLIGGVYFILFHVLGLYIFLNLVIPLVYKGYKETRKASILKDAARERKALASAFVVLDEIDPQHRGGLDFETCYKVFVEVNPKMTRKRATVLFNAIDTDRSNSLDIVEWFTLIDAFQFDFTLPRDLPTARGLLRRAAQADRSQRGIAGSLLRFRASLIRMVESSRFMMAILFVICANSVVLALYGTVSENDESVLVALDQIFVGVFAVEILIKLVAYSPGGFWASGWNRFDFFVTTASIISIVLEYLTDTEGTVAIVFGVVKVMRLFRVFSMSTKLREFISTLFDLVPIVWSMVLFLIVGMYSFNIMGMELFHMEYNNFYDAQHLAFSGFSTTTLILFQLMFQSNWDLILLAARDTVSPFTSWYFFAWQFFTVYLVLNIMVALILDNFEFQQYSKAVQEESGAASVADDNAFESASDALSPRSESGDPLLRKASLRSMDSDSAMTPAPDPLERRTSAFGDGDNILMKRRATEKDMLLTGATAGALERRPSAAVRGRTAAGSASDLLSLPSEPSISLRRRATEKDMLLNT